jgi:arylsulfate sulfotransferase
MQASAGVALNPSVPAPVPVGTVVTWTATVDGAGSDNWSYRFRSRVVGSDFHMVRDFSPSASLDWTASDREGLYDIEVTARDNSTGDTFVQSSLYQISPVTTGDPSISPTSNPLVFLYSTGPCAAGSRMGVQFQSPDGVTQSTNWKTCVPGASMNFYIAGLRTNSQYSVQQVIDTGSQFVTGPSLTLTSGDAPNPIGSFQILQAPVAPVLDGVLLQSSLSGQFAATDLNGNLLWYYAGNVRWLTRPEPGGHFLTILVDGSTDTTKQILREIDLAGNTTLETNASRINEQLSAMGKNTIIAFSHEAVRMRDRNIMVLANTERILTDVQGPGDVDVVGDMILVLDQNLQVVWAWDAFDHLDPTRQATLGETCDVSGCSIHLAPIANDWLHGNALQETAEGNILYSIRHQDWVVKIDYENGNGTGNILWKLGADGDFQIRSTDPNPWFSHQHQSNFLLDGTTMLVYDDGNVRHSQDSSVHSRGQVLQIDEQNRLASLIVNADMGTYSQACGSAQSLANGDYHFGGAFNLDGTSTSIEVNPSGNLVYAVQASGAEYRSFRMKDLYTPY